MKKIHFRQSMELEVTDEQFEKLKKDASNAEGNIEYELNVEEIEKIADISKAKPCEWDSGGYMPSDWLVFDARYQ